MDMLLLVRGWIEYSGANEGNTFMLIKQNEYGILEHIYKSI